MPLTPRAIADRRAACTFTYAGEPVQITYYQGRITALSKEAIEAKQTELNALAERPEEEQRAALAAFVLDFLASWDVVESVADDGTPGPLLPLDVATLATLDPDFLGALLAAMIEDAKAGKATGTKPPASSAAIS